MFQGRFAVFAAILVAQAIFAASPAFSQEAFSAAAPHNARKSKPIEAFRGSAEAALRVELPPPDATAADALRERNSNAVEKRLEIGFGRSLAGRSDAGSEALTWERVAGGRAARWEVTSSGALAVRIGLEVARLPRGAELRFAGSGDPSTVYGPFAGDEVYLLPAYWSPVLEGERGTVEVFVPEGEDPGAVRIALLWVSHLIASPRSAGLEKLLKTAGACERDLICLSASDAALEATGRSVARMTFSDGLGGGTFTCTGTLLATTAGPARPYFYSANHCISTQASASTLTTHWNFDFTTCGGLITSPLYVQLTGGATLLYNNVSSDVLLLRLNENDTLPANVIYAGWSAATLSNGTALTAVHHPQSDRKKVSLATMGGFSAYGGGAGSTHIISLWNSTATGVTEGGSSGSGIFTAVGSSPVVSYQLRGGLQGGPSSCLATGVDLRDYYSRFDNAYPFLRQYLDAACSFSLSQTSASVVAGGAPGSFNVTASACAWTAVSDASWITTTSTGTGSGTVSYTVAPNTGGARSGNIIVGSQTFSISQTAGLTGTDVLVNGDFEQGAVVWTRTSSVGSSLIVNEPGATHQGTYDARLGGVVLGTDVMYQDFTIPANATSATLRFWRRITTADVPGQYDKLFVELVSPSSGATLTTLVTLYNDDASASWVEHTFDVLSFKGQTVRLRFTATNDYSDVTTFRLDDVSLYTVTVVNPPRLGNISTRMQVLTGNDVLIGGFVIAGATPKTVAIVATGPSLTQYGIANALANPTLSLVRQSDQAVLATNDNWAAAANASAIISSGFAPSNPLESAILTTLAPGAYTAIVSGVGGTGVGIVAVYEVDHPEIPLTNISTRGQVLTGSDVMIGGFIVQGTGPQQVAIVATGPSLTQYGIANALANPTLSLVRQSDQVVIATNDNWGTAANAAAITASGFAPSNPLESAILISLPPGAYTAILSGAGGGTGVGIIGVYTTP